MGKTRKEDILSISWSVQSWRKFRSNKLNKKCKKGVKTQVPALHMGALCFLLNLLETEILLFMAFLDWGWPPFSLWPSYKLLSFICWGFHYTHVVYHGGASLLWFLKCNFCLLICENPYLNFVINISFVFTIDKSLKENKLFMLRHQKLFCP